MSFCPQIWCKCKSRPLPGTDEAMELHIQPHTEESARGRAGVFSPQLPPGVVGAVQWWGGAHAAQRVRRPALLLRLWGQTPDNKISLSMSLHGRVPIFILTQHAVLLLRYIIHTLSKKLSLRLVLFEIILSRLEASWLRSTTSVSYISKLLRHPVLYRFW